MATKHAKKDKIEDNIHHSYGGAVARTISNLIRLSDRGPREVSLTDIVSFYKNLYETLYKEFVKDSNVPAITDDYIKALKEEFTERLKQLDDKYIPFEIEAAVKGDDGKITKKKIKVNILARHIIEGIIYYFGAELFNYLAIRMPPPELYLILINHMEVLTTELSILQANYAKLLEVNIELTKELLKLKKIIKKNRKSSKNG